MSKFKKDDLIWLKVSKELVRPTTDGSQQLEENELLKGVINESSKDSIKGVYTITLEGDEWFTICKEEDLKLQRISFWDGNHPKQKQYLLLHDYYVPASGSCLDSGGKLDKTGELIRGVGRLFHDYCNNGNGSAAERQYEIEEEDCSDCNGSGDKDFGDGDYGECNGCAGTGCFNDEVEGDLKIDDFFGGLLSFIENGVKEAKNAVIAVRELILNDTLHGNYTYEQQEIDAYNNLTEIVVDHVTEIFKSNSIPNNDEACQLLDMGVREFEEFVSGDDFYYPFDIHGFGPEGVNKLILDWKICFGEKGVNNADDYVLTNFYCDSPAKNLWSVWMQKKHSFLLK